MRLVMGAMSRACRWLWVGIICVCKGRSWGDVCTRMSSYVCVHSVPGPRGRAWIKGVGVRVCVCVLTAAESLRSHVLMGTVCCAWAAPTRRWWGQGCGDEGACRAQGGVLAQRHRVSFGAAAAVEEEHKLLGDNREDSICFRT